MQVTLYKLIGEKILLDKTNYIESYGSATCALRDECSITNPEILIGANFIGNDTIPNCNYCYIDTFGRYYYIVNIVVERSGAFRLSLSVDVLMSFKDEINQLGGIAERYEYSDIVNIKDTAAIVGEDISFDIYENSITANVFTQNNTYVSVSPYYNFKGTSVGLVTLSINVNNSVQDNLESINNDRFYYNCSDGYEPIPQNSTIQYNYPSAFRLFMPNIGNYSASWPITNVNDIGVLLEWAHNSESVANAISSIRVYPFDWSNIIDNIITQRHNRNFLVNNGINHPYGIENMTSDGGVFNTTEYSDWAEISPGGSAADIHLLGWYMTPTFPQVILAGRWEFFTSLNNDWKNFSPYSKWYIYIPFIGFKELDYARCVGKTLYLYYCVDWDSGDTNVILQTLDSNNKYLLIDKWEVNLGADIDISTTNRQENITKRNAIASTSATSALSSTILAAIAGLLTVTGNIGLGLGIITGATALGSVAASAVDSQTRINQIIDSTTKSSSIGNAVRMCSSLKPFIVRTKQDIRFPSNYSSIIGKIDKSYRTISNSNGYIQFSNIHIEGIGAATSNELDMIERYLKSGIIIPTSS